MSGCSASDDSRPYAAKSADSTPAPAFAKEAQIGQAAASIPQLNPRAVHREAVLSMRTADPEKAEGDIEKMLDGIGGFYLESNLKKDSGRATLSAKIKVPADRFQEAIQKISALGFVTFKSVAAQDITQALADLRRQELQLKTLQSDLGKQAAAGAATAQDQLNQANAKLQVIETEKKEKVATADYSTIELQMEQQMGLAPGEKDSGWFQNEMGSAMVAVGQGAKFGAVALIWLVVWSPVWVGLLLGIRWLDKLGKKGRFRPVPPPVA